MFCKFDTETNTLIAGPLAEPGDDTWVPFFPAHDLAPLQASTLAWDGEVGVVVQMAGAEYEAPTSELRSVAYGKITEQLDKLWHDIDAGTLDKTGAFYKHIETVKNQYPKGG